MSAILGDGTPFTAAGGADGTQVARYTLPNMGTFEVSSVVAEIDGTAAPAVAPILRLRDKSGAVIATKRQGSTIPAGDTGSATWALRLADESSTAATVGDYVFLDEQSPSPITSVIRFANIPGIYRHLRLELALQRTVAGGVATVPIRWNAAGSYSSAFIYYPSLGTIRRCKQVGDGDGVYLNFGHVDGAAGTSRAYELPNPGGGDFATYVIEFPFYSKADRAHKLVWQGAVGLGNALLHATGSGTDDGLNPPAPITQIDVLAQLGVLAPGSSGTLYGVK